MANGGKTPNGKKKAAESAEVVSRQQAVENKKLVQRREAEDRVIAENIRKDIRSEVGPGTGRPSKNTGNVQLSTAKGQSITKTGYRLEGGYPRGELVKEFSGEKQQPIYRSGETLGYAPKREISSGRGFTLGSASIYPFAHGKPAPTAQRAVGAPVAKQQLAKAGDYTEKEKEFFKKYPSAQRPQILPKGGIK